MTDLVNQQLGNYRVLRLLGSGGFADVYLGEHVYLLNQVAVKVLHTRLSQADVQGFLEEGRTLVKLRHPQIVRVLDFGVQNSMPFLVMDYAPGGTLRQRHPRGGAPLAPATILPYLTQVAQALHYAHEQGLIHRDIKPENMLVGERGEVLLSDFGIAVLVQSSQSGSTKGMAGTMPYMAPEQINEHPRRASDQYALGIVAYEWLTGKLPFMGTFTEVAIKHMTVPPPPLRGHVSSLPPALEAVVLKALAKNPDERYANVQAFAEAFARASTAAAPQPARATPAMPQKTKEEWVKEGDAHKQAKRYEEALAAYEQAIRLAPNDPYPYDKKGWVLLESLKRPAEALAAYERVIALGLNNAIAWNCKGNALRNLKRYEEALAAYERALQLDPNYAIAWNGKGNALDDLKRYQEALAAYERALQLNPNYTLAWNGKGIALDDLKRYQEALAAYEHALQLDPNYTSAWHNKGIVLRNLNRPAEALAAYEHALQLDPNYTSAWNGKGNALDDLKRYEEALAAYERALQLDPNYATAWHNKGIALRNLKRTEEALTAHERAIQLDPNYASAWAGKGNILNDLVRYPEALAACERATQLDLNYAYAWNTKGIILENMKRYQDALQAYEQAIKCNPQDGKYWRDKGDALKQLGRAAEAEQAYKKARELGYSW